MREQFKLVPLLFFVMLLTSCASLERTFFSKDIAKLTIGMSIDEVIAIINQPNRMLYAEATENGVIEVFEYVEKPLWVGRGNSTYWESWLVAFRDGKYIGARYDDVLNDRKRRQQSLDWATARVISSMYHERNSASSYGYAWDSFYNDNYILIWRCRDKNNGQFVSNSLCVGQTKVDDTWPSKAKK